MDVSNSLSIKKIFAKNLRTISLSKSNIAVACREMSINRQQYNKYLSAKVLPSDRNMSIIAKYFGVTIESLFVKNEFANNTGRFYEIPGDVIYIDKLVKLSHTKLKEGAYYIYRRDSRLGSKFKRSILNIRTVGSLSLFSLYRSDRIQSKRSKYVFRERFDGVIADHRTHISMTGISRSFDGSIIHMLVRPLHDDDVRLLTGLSLTSESGEPTGSRFVMEYVGSKFSQLDLAKKCGIFSIDAEILDPLISEFITNYTEKDANTIVYSRLEP